jgi:hypothetical protein
MKNNIGALDRTIRVIIGAAIIITGAYLKSVWGVIGMIPIISAFNGTCPFYLLLGISTLHKKAKVRQT